MTALISFAVRCILVCQLCVVALGANDNIKWHPRHPHSSYHHDWGIEAATNLTIWRSGLLKAWRQSRPEHTVAPSPWWSWLNPFHSISKRRAQRTVMDRRWELFAPFITCPPGHPMQRIGNAADGGKELCGPSKLAPPCLIFSLGSNGDYSFERGILNATQCQVHTFDCTHKPDYDYLKQLLGPRHTYHELCVGATPANPKPGWKFSPLKDILASMGNPRVDLLKVDIEGFEMQLLQDWREGESLPYQISIELHFGIPPGDPRDPALQTDTEMALVFGHLANLGYGIVSREYNTEAGSCCTEFTLLRVEVSFDRSQNGSLHRGARHHMRHSGV